MDDPDDRAAELAREQAYFDTAAIHRERRRDALGDSARAGAHASAAAQLRQHAQAAADALGAAGTAVAFGRINNDGGESLYIGRHLIRDDDAEVLVVNWQSPAAAPYFEASHADPAGLVLRRAFTCDGNVIQHFTDVRFAELADALADDHPSPVDQALLNELGRGRTGSMRDIVATIQAAQYDVIRAPQEQLLIIEGGPGTGKTAVALHRVSYLLFQHRERMTPEQVLVVGPHPTFIRYLAEVLPGLGDDGVAMRTLAQLGPPVRIDRAEPPAVSRIKGDPRLAQVLKRALAARIGQPEPAERLLINGRFHTLPGATVAEAVAASNAADLPYAAQRQQLRARLTQLVTELGADPAAGREPLDNLLERLWPAQSAAGLLRDLFGSRRRLEIAADELTDDERGLLYRRGADRVSAESWSLADLPLLDEAEQLINGPPQQYAHIVVDEAQDLSPMQLRSVARRSATGSMTVVGDLAQATGGWAQQSWEAVAEHLPNTHPMQVTPLRYGYRVPRQAYRFAARLLPVAAPGVVAPEVVRDGPADYAIHRVELARRAATVAAVATARADDGQFVGVVCPPRCRREVAEALSAAGAQWASGAEGELGRAINLIDPYEAKGLEFDAVVVVEPEQIVAGDAHGHRLLYVALTRTTRYLDVVSVGEPLPLGMPAGTDPTGTVQPAEPPTFSAREARQLAGHLAERLRSAAPPAAWPQVLELLGDELNAAESSPPAELNSPGD
ncbi:AAA family ATPase [Natronosporangium hydrolyticum]|uniref:AAA family ATPase n=1 Tax=Natronosporangium hydrolyticum TaxID=2811111 RepID=A0A895Y783_9ACTN|nr:UvrD-helicase domain-containing protein [Natronosporangium hydrolyticum]QSB13221.1 AAA family ATPase [Natronosporangium hydrolyticum]